MADSIFGITTTCNAQSYLSEKILVGENKVHNNNYTPCKTKVEQAPALLEATRRPNMK
jgi:hypothetical protein